MNSGQLIVMTLLVLVSSQLCTAEMLRTPHVVSGQVFDDWDGDGIKDPLEPGIPSVEVSLWYYPTGDYAVLDEGNAKYVKLDSYVTKYGADLHSGQFRFTCLASGSYKVSVSLQTTRPGTISPADVGDDDSIDSDLVSVDGNQIAWSEPFMAEEAGSTHIGAGLVQTIFAVAFSLTGDQTQPEPSVTTTVGSCYAALNKSNGQLYFRIVRGEWSEGEIEEPGGFYQGWEDEAPGFQVRSLGDVTNEKENVWFIPRTSFVEDMIMGRMLVQLQATGSFSDLSRLRGQFSRFRRATFQETMIPLTGSHVVPTPVSSTISGSAMFYLDLERHQLEYEIWYDELFQDEEISSSLHAPAAVGEIAESVFEFPLGTYKSGKIEGLTEEFMVQLLDSQVYVSVNTENHPDGLLRGQIRAWQQTQYQAVIVLKPTMPENGIQAFGDAVFQIDLRRNTLTYYVLFGGLSADETFAMAGPVGLEGDVVEAYRDGVKQGFVYLNSEEINAFLRGDYSVEIGSAMGVEIANEIANWH